MCTIYCKYKEKKKDMKNKTNGTKQIPRGTQASNKKQKGFFLLNFPVRAEIGSELI